MKKNKSTIYFRYEFTDESGRPEGGDIFQFSTMNEVQEMAAEIVKVAQSDQVAVNLTIGEKTPFFGFLKKVGMNKKAVEMEMVEDSITPFTAPAKAPKKKAKAKTKAKKK